MVLHQFIQLVEKIFREQETQQFIRLLETISSAHDEFTTKVLDVIKNGNIDEASTQYQDGLARAEKIVKDIKPKTFFVSVEFVEKNLISVFGNQLLLPIGGPFFENGSDSDKLDDDYNLQKLLSELSDSYESYLRASGDQKKEIIALCEASMRFSNTFKATKNVLQQIKKNLYRIDSLSEKGETKRISILLGSTLSLKIFAEKLLAINNIYEELCNLINTSLTEHPIIIIKIESGSFWTDILGYPKIIELMEFIIKNSISYIYRNFTVEGKISAIPKKVEAIDSIINLRTKLTAEGIGTDHLDEHINKSSVILAKELNKLLAGEPRVTINDQIYSVSKELEQKFLTESQMLSISDTSESSQ